MEQYFVKFKIYYTKVDRFITLIFLNIFITRVMYFSFLMSTQMLNTEGDYNLSVYICFITAIPFFYSLVRQTVIYDESFRKKYLQYNDINSYKLKSNFLFIIKQKQFWIKAAIFTIIYLILPLNWTFIAYVDIFINSGILNSYTIALLFLLLIYFILDILAHLSAIKFWNKDKHNKPEHNTRAYISGIVFVCFSYSMGAFALFVFIPLIASLVPIIKKVVTLKVITVVILISAFLIIFRLMRSVLKRNACIKRLKQICKENNYALSEFKHHFKSLIKPEKGDSFTVTVNNKCYSCKFIATKRKSVPLIIYPNGILAFIYTINLLRIQLFKYALKYNYGYESEYKKILIINPVPKSVLSVNGDRTFEIDNGEIVGKYKVFTASAFLNALERDVLDR